MKVIGRLNKLLGSKPNGDLDRNITIAGLAFKSEYGAIRPLGFYANRKGDLKEFMDEEMLHYIARALDVMSTSIVRKAIAIARTDQELARMEAQPRSVESEERVCS